jgi:hypothetical protein
MLAQNISVCGNLFGKTLRSFYFNREEKVLSSTELVNAAGVVQAHAPVVSPQPSGKTDPKLPHDVILLQP